MVIIMTSDTTISRLIAFHRHRSHAIGGYNHLRATINQTPAGQEIIGDPARLLAEVIKHYPYYERFIAPYGVRGFTVKDHCGSKILVVLLAIKSPSHGAKVDVSLMRCFLELGRNKADRAPTTHTEFRQDEGDSIMMTKPTKPALTKAVWESVADRPQWDGLKVLLDNITNEDSPKALAEASLWVLRTIVVAKAELEKLQIKHLEECSRRQWHDETNGHA